jgi:hypothetical protein
MPKIKDNELRMEEAADQVQSQARTICDLKAEIERPLQSVVESCRWIPVEEELPELKNTHNPFAGNMWSNDVLLRRADGEFLVGFLNLPGIWTILGQYSTASIPLEEVTHWRRIEPPKEES